MVAIKDMEMPSCCLKQTYVEILEVCPLYSICAYKDERNNTDRPQDCPLVEIEESKLSIDTPRGFCCRSISDKRYNKVEILDVKKLNGLFPRNKQEQNTEWTSKTEPY